MSNTTNPITARRLKDRKSLIIAIAIIAVAAAGFYLFYAFIVKWTYIEHDIGWNKDVRREPVYAAREFLEKQGIETEYRRSFALFDKLDGNSSRNTPGPNDTIVLFDSFGVISEARFEKLSPWLHSGGTLVTSTYNPRNKGVEPDELFYYLGVEVHESISPIELRQGENQEDAEQRVKQRRFPFEGFLKDIAEEAKKTEQKNKQNIEDGEFLKKADKSSSRSETLEPEQSAAKDNEKAEGGEDKNSKNKTDSSLLQPEKLDKTDADKAEGSVEEKSDAKSDEKPDEQEEKYGSYKHYNPSECPKLAAATLIPFSSEAEPLAVHFNRGRLFDYMDESAEPEGWVGDENGMLFAQYLMNNGQVYITVNNHIWWNENIACLDNAYLLLKIINRDGKVWFVQNMESPALSEAAWQFAPAVVIGLTIALLLWLWFTSRRFGPVFPERDLSRRSFAEHLRAHARFLWRKQAHQRMLNSLRHSVFALLSRKISRFDTLPEKEKLDHLEALFKMDRTELYRAFIKTDIDDPNELVTVVQCLKQIKDSL